MNIFNKITLQSLKKNKTRTIVTIIGIILSTALICAVTTSVSSFFDYIKRSVIYQDGNWQGSAQNIDYDSYIDIKNSDEISESVFAQQIGYAKVESRNKAKPYLYILGADKDFSDTMSIHLTSGRLPENPNEIILSDRLSIDGGIHYSSGDIVELEIGQRMLDGYSLGQHNPYYVYDDNGYPIESTEILSGNEKRTFTVVGFFERPGFENWDAPGYTAITACSTENMDSFKYDSYFSMKNPKDIYKFMEKNGFEGETNYELLMCLGVTRYDGFSNLILNLAAFVILLIIFGSVSLIYNAFSISVSERTKQFGLLSSIGATKKQLRRTVFYEAGVVSLVGIPIGIFVGIAGIGTTLALISDKFDQLIGQASESVKMKLCVSWASVIAACIIALVTVLISAYIPSKRATKISAVEAIRQSSDIKSEKKAFKTPKIIAKVFGLSGILAHKYYKRSRKKYRATVISLFMSIVLFIPATSLTNYLIDMANQTFGSYGYDLNYMPESADSSGFKEDDINKTLMNIEAVDHSAYCANLYEKVYFTEDCFSDQMKKFFIDYEVNRVHQINICFVNDDEFISLLDENNLKKEDYMNPDAPIAVTYDNFSFFDHDQEKMVNFNAITSDDFEAELELPKKMDGYYFERYYSEDTSVENAKETNYLIYRNVNDPEDSLKLEQNDATVKVKLKSGNVIHKAPFFIASHGNISMIYPYSAKNTLIPDNAEFDSYLSFKIQSGNHSECYQNIESLIDNSLLPAGAVTDYAEIAEGDRNIYTIIQVFAYGFIVLISLIAAANVFNTISTNINLRRREFAMLRSIGMTNKGFNRMMNFECLLYGIKSLLYGLPVSLVLTYWIYKSVLEGFDTSFRIPWSAIAVAVSSVFIVVFSTMMYSMRKIKKDNPIDALKNENI